MKRRIITAVLITLLVVCTFALAACSQQELSLRLEYSVLEEGGEDKNGNKTALSYYVSGIGECKDADIMIAAFCEGDKPVKSVGKGAFRNCTTLKTVQFEQGTQLQTIEDEAFSGCTGLTDIAIPESVRTIGNNAFSGCTALKSVIIPSGVTTIGSGAFRNCTNLESIVIPSTVKSIEGSAFDGCGALKYTVKDGAKYLGNKNNECFVLVKAVSTDITSCVIDNRTNLICSAAFDGCNKLIEIENRSILPLRAGSEDYGRVAYYAKNVYTPNEGESKLGEYQGFTFYEDEAADERYLLSYGGSDAQITLPDKYNEKNYGIYQYAFYGNETLTSVKLGSGVSSIGANAFMRCTRLGSIAIPAEVTEIGSGAFRNCSGLTDLTFVAGSKLRSIGVNAFSYCTSLRAIDIPDGVTEIGNGALIGCSDIQTIKIPSTVTTLGTDIFTNCNKLQYNVKDGANYIGNDEDPYLILVKADTEIAECTVDDGTKFIYGSAFYGCRNLKTIVIPSGVTNIGDNAFGNCLIEDATIPAMACAFIANPELSRVVITDGESVASDAFYGCVSLTEVEFPAGLKTIGDRAFYGCDNIEEIRLPSGLISVGSEAFYGCAGIHSVDFPDNTTEIGERAFSGCTRLQSVTIGARVSDIGEGAFEGCTKLIEVFNKSGLTLDEGSDRYGKVAQYAKNIYTPDGGETRLRHDNSFNFYVDEQGGEIYLLGYDGEEIVVNLPRDYNGNQYEVYQYAFAGSAITKITVPAKVSVIGNYAFSGCRSLAEVSFDAESELVKIGEYAFDGCVLLDAIEIPQGVSEIADYAFAGNEKLESVSFDAESELVKIGEHAFDGCVLLGAIAIPQDVSVIGGYAFSGCEKLANVTFGASLKTIGTRAFAGCDELVNVTIPEGVLGIGNGAFRGCGKLAKISIPSSIKSIGAEVFTGCDALEYKDTKTDGDDEVPLDAKYLGNSENEYLVLVKIASNKSSCEIAETTAFIYDSAFAGSTLSEINIPASVTTIGDSAFSGCDRLTSVTFADDGKLSAIGAYAFRDCRRLESVDIPSTVTSIGDEAFQNCVALEFATVPSGVTALGNSAFQGCTSLTKVVIDGSDLAIGAFAFYGCSALDEVYFHGSAAQWAELEIGQNNAPLTSATVYFWADTDPREVAGYDDSVGYWHYNEGEIAVWGK